MMDAMAVHETGRAIDSHMKTAEIWYEIQYSIHGEDDWFSANTSADTIESARKRLTEFGTRPTIDFRIVKVSRIEELVSLD